MDGDGQSGASGLEGADAEEAMDDAVQLASASQLWQVFEQSIRPLSLGAHPVSIVVITPFLLHTRLRAFVEESQSHLGGTLWCWT